MIDNEGSSGTLLLSATYDGFGGENVSPTTYLGDAYDGYGPQWGYFADNTGTGLELLGYRYYDPANGRFINRDPIGYDGGIDLYSYADNAPDQFVDPDGTDWRAVCKGVVHAIMGLCHHPIRPGKTYSGPEEPVKPPVMVDPRPAPTVPPAPYPVSPTGPVPPTAGPGGGGMGGGGDGGMGGGGDGGSNGGGGGIDLCPGKNEDLPGPVDG